MALVFLAFILSDKLMSFLLPIFCITPFGVAVMGKASLKIACIGHSYSGKPRVRNDIVFILGPFYINKNPFCYPYFLLTSNGDFLG